MKGVIVLVVPIAENRDFFKQVKRNLPLLDAVKQIGKAALGLSNIGLPRLGHGVISDYTGG
jgi:hypothetical protein